MRRSSSRAAVGVECCDCPHCLLPVEVEFSTTAMVKRIHGRDLFKTTKPVSSSGRKITGLFEARWRGSMYEARFIDLTPWTGIAWFDHDSEGGYVANFVADTPSIRATSVRRIRRAVEVEIRRRVEVVL